MSGLVPPEFANFAPSNVLSQQAISPFGPYIQGLLKNIKINRPSLVPPDISPTASGWQGRAVGVNVLRSDNDAQDTAQHELLHALAQTHFLYRTEDRMGWPGLRATLAPYPYLVAHYGADYPHAFVYLAQRTMEDPSSLPDSVRAYFDPLRR